MNFFTFLGEWINANPGKAVGGAIGFILGLLFLTIGFVKTLLVLILVIIGFVIGKMIDDDVPFLSGLFGKKKKDDDLDDI